MKSFDASPRNSQSFAFGPFLLVPDRQLLLENGAPVRIGARALDILTVLVARAGETVDKNELIALVWPKTVVEQGNLKVNMVALRRALAEHPSEPSYIATISGRGYKFIAPVRALDSGEVPPDRVQAHQLASGLPPVTSAIIGRDGAISAVRDSLRQSRLVSIIGPGGIGKTTVAISVAERIERESDIDVTFVDLARVAADEFVPASLLTALGISSVSGDSLQAVAAVLAKRRTLLVLDTCEHVLGAVALVARVILAKTAEVRILATSRQVLRVKEEKIEWLGPLDLPPTGARSAIDVLRYSGPQLLLDRARDRSGFELADRDAFAFAEICRLLDGAPLALELVASRFSGRTAGAILDELDQRFRALTLTGVGAVPRQQTLLATLQWSYSLLTGVEAKLLRAVSVFAGTFDIDSAVAVVARRSLDLSEVFDAISGLRSKSMLSVDQSLGRLRYRLLDATRTFARELLATNGELPQVSAMHARRLLEMLTLANAERALLSTHEARITFVGLADDLRKALDWALYQSGDLELGIQLAAAGLPLWRELSLPEELWANCEHAVAQFDRLGGADKSLKLKLVVGLASASTYLSTDYDRTIALHESAIQLAQATGDPVSECRALSALVTYSLLHFRRQTPLELVGALRAAAARTNDRFAMREYELLRAQCDANSGQFDSYYGRLERLNREIGGADEGSTPRFQIFQRTNAEVQFAAASWLTGRPGDAVSRALHAVRWAIDSSHALTLVHSLVRGVIWILYLCGDYVTARQYADLLMETVYRHGLSTWISSAEYYSAILDARSEEKRSVDALRASFESLRASIIQLRSHGFFANLALEMVEAGRPDEATLIVDYVFEAGPAVWCYPELLRARAMVESAFGRRREAIATLRQSMSAADSSGGVSWKLRSALSLARLLREQGESAEARQILQHVHAQIHNGFETRDVREARQLLADLAGN